MSLFKNKEKRSSREEIKIIEVRDNILVLDNNEYRQIIESSAINFELKNDEEQDLIIEAYQKFLNSLPCSIQILVRIRELDIDSYVAEVNKSKEKEKDKIYLKQIDDYGDFVKKLVDGNKIMSRKFYIIIPFRKINKKMQWAEIKEEINLLTKMVSKAFEKMQMKVKLLNDLEILNLFYQFYNHDSFKLQPLTEESLDNLLSKNYV